MRKKIPSTAALLAFEAAAPRELHPRRRGARAHAERDLPADRRARGLPRRAAVPPHPARRAAHRGGLSYSRQIAPRLDAIEHDTLAVMAHHGAGSVLELAVVPTFATRWLLPAWPVSRRGTRTWWWNMHTQTRPFLFDQTGVRRRDLLRRHRLAGHRGALPDAGISGAGMRPGPASVREQMSRTRSPGCRCCGRPPAPTPGGSGSPRPACAPNDMGGMRLELFSMLAQA